LLRLGGEFSFVERVVLAAAFFATFADFWR
jgi:hypothetical protein